ncbi:DUF2218 domain-containing protein [Palleronia sp.]|uniref:DUF2218 domain-containing protein n=1 Tax=Palleronia sp. TaxID=1940284 RepID=UPI0035C78D09
MQEPIHDAGTYETASAWQYLQQLCKHFAHKVDASCADGEGHIAFPFGTAYLKATDTRLDIRVDAPSEGGLLKARQVIDNHLSRFAFREEVKTVTWQSAA